jgi:hypothetical protein
MSEVRPPSIPFSNSFLFLFPMPGSTAIDTHCRRPVADTSTQSGEPDEPTKTEKLRRRIERATANGDLKKAAELKARLTGFRRTEAGSEVELAHAPRRKRRPADERRAAIRRTKQEQWLRDNPASAPEGNCASEGQTCPKKPKRRVKRRRGDDCAVHDEIPMADLRRLPSTARARDSVDDDTDCSTEPLANGSQAPRWAPLADRCGP